MILNRCLFIYKLYPRTILNYKSNVYRVQFLHLGQNKQILIFLPDPKEFVHPLGYSLCALRTEGGIYANIPGRENEVQLLGLAFKASLSLAGAHVFGHITLLLHQPSFTH